jgi:hypothetical protein
VQTAGSLQQVALVRLSSNLFATANHKADNDHLNYFRCSWTFNYRRKLFILLLDSRIPLSYNSELLSEPFFTTMPFPTGSQFTTVGIVGIAVAVCFGFVLVLIVAVAFIRYSKYSFRLVSKKFSQRWRISLALCSLQKEQQIWQKTGSTGSNGFSLWEKKSKTATARNSSDDRNVQQNVHSAGHGLYRSE